MNERIRELFKKAGGKTTTHNLASNPVQYREISELWDGHIDKFAELIVRECAKLASEETSLPYNSYSEKIKQHFGVEE